MGSPAAAGRSWPAPTQIVDELLESVVTDLPFSQGDDVALMINGLGGTPISELYILYGRAHSELAKRGINVRRNYVGEYCTSLDMAGASLTLQPAGPGDRRAARRTGRDRHQDVLTPLRVRGRRVRVRSLPRGRRAARGPVTGPLARRHRRDIRAAAHHLRDAAHGPVHDVFHDPAEVPAS